MKILTRVTAFALFTLASTAQAALEFNMPKGVTGTSHEVYHLHMLVFWTCVVIGTLVFAVMIWSLIYHRKSRGYKAAQFHESTVVEVVWTIVPFLILIAVVIPAAGTLIRMEDTSGSDLTIKATGYQWLWEYTYIDKGVDFYSRLAASSDKARQLRSGIDPNTVDHYLRDVDNRMVVPVGKKVRLLLTSGDVIHAWWVPELNGKKDAIPGYINEIWFKVDKPGVYRGQCAELCGRGHGFMPIVVEAVSPEKFDAWIKSKGGHLDSKGKQVAESKPGSGRQTTVDANVSAPGSQTDADDDASTDAAAESGDTAGKSGDASGELSKATLMSNGKEAFDANCAACHQADGSGLAAAGFPALKGDKIATGPVNGTINQVLNGKNAMPPFKGSLNDSQIAAIVTYVHNAFGNDTGDVVQPDQVKAQR